MNKYVFLFAFIVLTISQQVSPLCSSNNACNVLSNNNNYCDTTTPSTPTCLLRAQKAAGSTGNNPNTDYCLGSFSFTSRGRNGLSCLTLSGPGCLITTSTTVCAGSTQNSTTNICTEQTNTNQIVVGVGQRCGGNALPTPVCDANSMCVQNVCRPQLNQGDNCYGSQSGNCGVGLVCSNDICQVAYSQPDESRCTNPGVCQSGQCDSNGYCDSIRLETCYSNADCTLLGSTCLTTAVGTKGYCTISPYKATQALNMCQINNCKNVQTQNDCLSLCTQQYVKLKCSIACQQRPDLRYDVTDAYIYDCLALTRTKQTNVCGYTTVYNNCPTQFETS